MNRIKKVFTLIHIGLWMLLTLLVSLQLGSDGTANWRTLTLGFILTCLSIFYGHFLLLTLYRGKKNGYFLRLAGIVLTGPFPFLISHYLRQEVPDFELLFEYYSMALITVMPVFIFLSWLARVTENLVLNTIRKEQLEKQAVEAELYYLKSQINPHFLFNTLNNIHTLVYKQAPAAPEAVMRLASLMRYMIYESNAPLVPLAREMNYLHDYVSLQQLRYKNSPVVNLEIAGDPAACHIAPLLFIHLLENTYKHSPARLEPGAIQVHVAILENTLTFRLQNPVSENRGNALEEPGGIGLQNVRKRLALLYPDRHTLEINRTGGIFTITLAISGLHAPAHESKAHLLYN